LFLKLFERPPQHLTPSEQLLVAKVDRLSGLTMKIGGGIVIFLVFLMVAYPRGEKDGQKELRNPSTAVWFSFDESASKRLESALIQANANHQLMLLAQTKDLSVVFIKSTTQKLQDGLFIIPVAKVSEIHTKRLHPYK
jgi:hypothetical protein